VRDYDFLIKNEMNDLLKFSPELFNFDYMFMEKLLGFKRFYEEECEDLVIISYYIN
jgi:hypothetical protein